MWWSSGTGKETRHILLIRFQQVLSLKYNTQETDDSLARVCARANLHTECRRQIRLLSALLGDYL